MYFEEHDDLTDDVTLKNIYEKYDIKANYFKFALVLSVDFDQWGN